MRLRPGIAVIAAFVMVISLFYLLNGTENVEAQNTDPVLSGEGVCYDNDIEVTFYVNYTDVDGDEGTVELYLDYLNGSSLSMETDEPIPENGQDYWITLQASDVDDWTEFYFTADDGNGGFTTLNDGGDPFLVGDYLGWGERPTLSDPNVSLEGDDVVFRVFYQDNDGDNANVYYYYYDDYEEDWSYYEMATSDQDPFAGQNYIVEVTFDETSIDTAFYFEAYDSQGSIRYLNDINDEPFRVFDFIDPGENPNLSNPTAFINGTTVEFQVNYWDADGHEGYDVSLYYIDNETWEENDVVMTTDDPDPETGQIYTAQVPISQLNENFEFYFYAKDDHLAYTYLLDGTNNYIVGNFVDLDALPDGNGGTDTDSDGKWEIDLGEWFGDPEVVVGIVGLAALGGGAAYGAYRRKKKRSKFSDRLEELDEIYRSFKTNPHKCEIELEKMRAVINEDLKASTIDENNYTILRDRIDEILKEIRTDSLHTEIKDIPRELELRIKDMLIDGKITRDEYDKLLPVITGSDMASEDKEKLKNMMESWMEENEKGGKEKKGE